MDDQDVLHHLLKIEAEAAALVEDAQAEVDKRLAEEEKQHRYHYEERCAQEAAKLNAQFEKELSEIKEDYQKQLAIYRKSLDTMIIYTQEFSAFVDHCILKEG